MGNRSSYTQLEDVKRLLRQQQKRIKFSSSYRRLEWNTGNQGTIRLIGLAIDNSYAGHERFEITFTDSTNFTLIGVEQGYLGDGSVLLSFVSNDGIFTIETSKWTGSAEAGDKVSWETDSNISDVDARGFMNDAFKYTNGMLEEFFNDDEIPFYDEGQPVPSGIGLANLLLTGALIFEATFVGQDMERSPVQVWVERADKLIERYIESAKKGGRPHWRSKAVHVTDTGIEGVEDGLIQGSSDDGRYQR